MQKLINPWIPSGMRNATTVSEWPQLLPDQQHALVKIYTAMIQEENLHDLEATFKSVAIIFHSEKPKVIIGFERGEMIMRVHPDSKDELIKRLTDKLL